MKAGFALRYINIFFTPSFVLLPLSPAIGGVEVGKIIAVFSESLIRIVIPLPNAGQNNNMLAF